MRVNFTLNENNNKDKAIIDFLKSKYNATYYLKNLLYDLALGNNVLNTQKTKELKEEYEAIEDIDNIEL